MILCQEQFAKDVDRSVFPGQQGGPLMHIVAAKAVAFKEALQPEFKQYAKQIVANAKVLADALAGEGFRIISGGTDTHLMLVDVYAKGIFGSEAEHALGEAGITVNKNAIPYDTNPPMKASGIRIGTPALTTRGMKEPEMKQIAVWIAEALEHRNDAAQAGEDQRPGAGDGGAVPAVPMAAGLMPPLLFSFLLGAFCGSRTMLPTGVLCWFAFVGRLQTGGTWFAFLGQPLPVAIFTTAVIAELLVDKLPFTPSRLKAPLLIARLCAGAFVGAVLAAVMLENGHAGALLGASGALIGALVGYALRMGIAKKTGWPDYVVALMEDATTIVGSILVVAVALARLN